jgi:hypothetical protein
MFAIVDMQAVFHTHCLLSLWFILVPISYASSNRLLVISIRKPLHGRGLLFYILRKYYPIKSCTVSCVITAPIMCLLLIMGQVAPHQWHNVHIRFREKRSEFPKLCVRHTQAHAHKYRKHGDLQVLLLTRKECMARIRHIVTPDVYVCNV